MAVFQVKSSQNPHKNFYAYYRKDLTQIRYKCRKPPAVTIYRGNFAPKKFTGKEQDQETGLYYFGARYLDPKTSRWLSTDPALGDYLPVAPNGDDAKKHNQNLPGMGGVFNVVNLHVYHYAGNNPVKYVDPDGEKFFWNNDPISNSFPLSNIDGPMRVVLNYTSIGKINRAIFETSPIPFNASMAFLLGRKGTCEAFYFNGALIRVDITLKNTLNYWQKVLTLAHELGHASVALNEMVYESASGEIAAFSAQFSAAAELYASSGLAVKERWNKALRDTMPNVDFLEVYKLFDISKSYAEQSVEFQAALTAAAIKYYKNNDAF